MGTTIRLATVEDLDAIAQLNEVVQRLHVEHEPAYFNAPNREDAKAWFSEFLTRPGARTWIAEIDGACVGYVATEMMDRPSTAFFPRRRWCEVHQIGVVPEHRREGIGRGLVQAAMHAAAESDVREVQLSAWAFNGEAQRAFLQLGFVPSLTRFVQEVKGTGAPGL